MTDNTSVTLLVRAKDFSENEELFDGPDEENKIGDDFISLEFFDVNCGTLDFENTLREKRIPYDKTWGNGAGYNCGTEYCRVLASGIVEMKEFSGTNKNHVDLSDLIDAYKSESGWVGVIDFIENKANEVMVMSWEDQAIIMQGRDETNEFLSNEDIEAVDDLVVDMQCLRSTLVNAENEDEQEEATLLAEKQASDINNQGIEHQSAYLLNSGYLAPGVTAHRVPLFGLDSESAIFS